MKHRMATVAVMAIMTCSAQLSSASVYGSADFRDAVRLYEHGMYSRASLILEDIVSRSPDAMNEGYLLLCAIKTGTPGYDDNVRSYTSRYGSTPLSTMIHHAYGLMLFDEGKYSASVAQLDQVGKKSLSRLELTELLYKKAYCSYVLGDYDVAEEGLRNVLKRPASEYVAPAQYTLAYIIYNNCDFKQAFPLFESASKDPRFEEQAQYYMLECKFMEKDYLYVSKYGDEVYSKIPEERKAHLARILSESYLVMGNSGKAKKYYDVAMVEKENLNSADAFYAGSLQYSLGDYTKAIEYFRQMGEMRDSTGQIASYQMGYSYIQTKNKVAAMDAFRNASVLPYDKKIQEDALFNYAKLSFDLNHDSSAFKEYLSRYKTSGKNDMIYDYIAVASLFNADYAGAVEAYDNIESLTPAMKVNYMKANYLRAEQLIGGGSYRDAVPYLRSATFFTQRQDNINKLSRYWLAESYYHNDNYQEAEKILNDLYNQSALDNKMEGRLIPYNLAYCYFREGAWTSAATWFAKYLDSGSSSFREDAMIRRADCDFIRKDYKAAVTNYESVISEFGSTDNVYPYYQQGLCYGLLGKRAEKIEVLSKVKGSSPSAAFYSDAMYELGRTYVAQKKEAQAIECFKNLARDSKDASFAAKSLIELGMIERNNSRYSSALNYYKQVAEDYRGTESADAALLAIESIYQSQGEPEKFLEYSEELGSPAKSAEEKELVFFNSAEQVFLTANYEKALAAITKYQEKYPEGIKKTQADYYQAECYKSLGNKEKACDSYARVFKADDAGSLKELSLANFASLSFGLAHYSEAYSAFVQLYDIAQISTNKSSAQLGMMRSAYQAHLYDEAIAASDIVSGSAASNGDEEREAQYVKAKSLLATSRRDEAFGILRTLSATPDTKEGAEASYLIIQDTYDQGHFSEVEKAVYKFVDAAPNQAYWLAKSFIVLGDSFVENDNLRQAKATFESIKNGYVPASGTSDDVTENVRIRLEKLEKLMNN